LIIAKNIFGKIIELTFTAIIGGFIAIYVFGTSQLEYKDGFKEQYFDIPAKVPDDLVIQYKGKKIENISVYDFAIYNRTFKDLKDVIIYFEVSGKKGMNIPQIISRGVYSPSRLPENIGIHEVDQEEKNIYAFKIDVIKQTGSNSYYLARFIFEGKANPNINISIPKNAGVDIKEYSQWREYTILISFLIGIILIFIITISLIDGRQNKSIWSKRKQRLIGVLDKTKSETLSENTICEIIDNYEDEFEPKTPYFYKKFTNIVNKFKSNKSLDDE